MGSCKSELASASFVAIGATPPCYRVTESGSDCKQAADPSDCSIESFDFKDGSCANAGFEYCYAARYGIELWTTASGCKEAAATLKSTGSPMDDCKEGNSCKSELAGGVL